MNNNLTEFNGGGSHEQNPLGGIPLGMNQVTGAPITVEEGETRTKILGRDFIFSNNYTVSKKIIKDYKLPEKLEGMKMSDASKEISKIFSDRADGISQNTINQFLGRLSAAQEDLKAKKLAKLQEAININNQHPDPSLGAAPLEAQGLEDPMMQEQAMMQQVIPDGLGSMGQQQMEQGGLVNPYIKELADFDLRNPTISDKKTQYSRNAIERNIKGWERNNNGNSDLNTLGDVGMNIGKSIPTVISLFDQASGNTSANTTQSAVSGAMTGLSAGAAFGPIGMGIGAAGGLIAGHIGANKAKENQIKTANEKAMKYNAQFQEQYADGGFPGIPTSNILMSNVYGGTVTPQRNRKLTPWEQQQFELGQSLLHDDSEELPGIVINTSRSTTPVVTTTPLVTTTTPPKEESKKTSKKVLNIADALRYIEPIGNMNQLASMQRPYMGNIHQDLTKASRDYIDEELMLRTIRNQGNTLNRSIQQSGMTEGARRAMMLGSGLNTQNALGSALIQAQQSNRQIDLTADQIDAATRQGNLQRRMIAEENYERDMGAYNTERSELTSQMYKNIGNIGLEGSRAFRVAKMFGYDKDGNYINNETGEKLDFSQLTSIVDGYRQQAANAATEHEKQVLEAKATQAKKEIDELIAARTLSAFKRR